MNDEPRVIYIRAGVSKDDRGDLAGLIGRIMREAITSSSQCFVLQLAGNQQVLDSLQAWKTLKQVTVKQGMALVVAGGSNEMRDLANLAGFPLVGTADTAEFAEVDLNRVRAQVLGYTLPAAQGQLEFEKLADEYREQESQAERRTVGGFIDFVRQNYASPSVKKR